MWDRSIPSSGHIDLITLKICLIMYVFVLLSGSKYHHPGEWDVVFL